MNNEDIDGDAIVINDDQSLDEQVVEVGDARQAGRQSTIQLPELDSVAQSAEIGRVSDLADPDFQNRQVVLPPLKKRQIISLEPTDEKIKEADVKPIESINRQLEVTGLMWDRDSHGLFDYESRTLERKVQTVTGCALLARDKHNNLKTVSPQQDVTTPSYSKMLSVVYRQGMYWLYHSQSLFKNAQRELDEKFPHVEQAWIIVRLQNTKSKMKIQTTSELQHRHMATKSSKDLLKIEEGDVIKFGRVRFRVRELRTEKNSSCELSDRGREAEDFYKGGEVLTTEMRSARLDGMERQDTVANIGTQMQSERSGRASARGIDDIIRQSDANFSFDVRTSMKFNDIKQIEEISGKKKPVKPENMNTTQSEQMVCRICLSEQELPSHELINPCICGGTMKMIGVSCLKEWLESKKHCKETHVVNSYIWKLLECEICKTPLKDRVMRRDGSIINLLNYNMFPNSKNYMVLESVTNTTSKTIHVVNFEMCFNVKVGRAQVAEVRITDISVSRFHSAICLQSDGSVTLQDNFSKFGTLLLVQKPLPLRKNNDAYYLQVGRALLCIDSSKRGSAWSRLACCWSKPKKLRQIENFLYYEEAAPNFPTEFNDIFKTYQVDYERPFYRKGDFDGEEHLFRQDSMADQAVKLTEEAQNSESEEQDSNDEESEEEESEEESDGEESEEEDSQQPEELKQDRDSNQQRNENINLEENKSDGSYPDSPRVGVQTKRDLLASGQEKEKRYTFESPREEGDTTVVPNKTLQQRQLPVDGSLRNLGSVAFEMKSNVNLKQVITDQENSLDENSGSKPLRARNFDHQRVYIEDLHGDTVQITDQRAQMQEFEENYPTQNIGEPPQPDRGWDKIEQTPEKTPLYPPSTSALEQKPVEQETVENIQQDRAKAETALDKSPEHEYRKQNTEIKPADASCDLQSIPSRPVLEDLDQAAQEEEEKHPDNSS